MALEAVMERFKENSPLTVMARLLMQQALTKGMARLDLYPGNVVTGEPPVVEGTPVVVQSFIFAQKGKQPIYLLLRSTGDVHEWNGREWQWRARCEPDPSGGGPARCVPPFTPGGEWHAP
jgi:hypothetical protein